MIDRDDFISWSHNFLNLFWCFNFTNYFNSIIGNPSNVMVTVFTSKTMSLPLQQAFASSGGRMTRTKGRFTTKLLVFNQEFSAVSTHCREHNKLLSTSCVLAAMVMAFSPMPAHSSDKAASLFENTCAGCHAGGGNVVRRDATLAYDDLQKFNVTSPEQLFELIYNGRGSMPGYGEKCSPKLACTFAKRLSDDEINELSLFVLNRAKNGWK